MNAIERTAILKLATALQSEKGFLEALGKMSVDAIKELLADISVDDKLVADDQTAFDKNKIGPAVRYIENHYDEEISLSKLAELCHLSVFHFSRQFKLISGKSPHQYLINCRLEQAKALLRTTNKPVTEIAIESGYKNASTFTAAFKQVEGIPPTIYRSNCTDLVQFG